MKKSNLNKQLAIFPSEIQYISNQIDQIIQPYHIHYVLFTSNKYMHTFKFNSECSICVELTLPAGGLISTHIHYSYTHHAISTLRFREHWAYDESDRKTTIG